MSDDRFKAITVDDMTMPGGWSVNDGQTFLREVLKEMKG